MELDLKLAEIKTTGLITIKITPKNCFVNLTVLNAQVKSKGTLNLKSVFCLSNLKKSEI
jgi:translation elongation factor EF-1beta